MTEKEFDIQVRNLLHDAEESVPGSVWEAVQAGIDKPARKVVPFWRWAGASVAVAAAAVAAFFVLRPTASPLEQIQHSTPVIASAEKPVVQVPAVQDVQAIPVPKEVPMKAIVAPAPLEVLVEIPEQKADESEQTTVNEHHADAIPSSVPSAGLSEQEKYNRLAFEQRRDKEQRGLSLLASANIQGNQRAEVGTAGLPRRWSAPLLGGREGIYNESPETSFRLPFSVGLGLKYNFTSRWALGTGIRYTNLSRTFVGDYISAEGFAITATDIDNQQHWLGVPLNFYYDIVNRGRWRVHAFAGGSAEWLIDNDFLVHSSPKDIHHHERGTLPQWSAAGGLGVEFKITPLVGIYLDPNFRYYFDSERQPRSLRTIQPLRFDIEAGVRFTFGER